MSTVSTEIDTYRLRLEGLMQACAAMTAAQGLEQTLSTVLRQARTFVPAEAGSLYVRAGDRLTFCAFQNEALQRDDSARGGPPIGASLAIDDRSIAGHVARTGRSLNIEDCYDLPADAPYQFNRMGELAGKYRVKSMLTVPLHDRGGEIVGVLQLINRKMSTTEASVFSDTDIDLLNSLSSVAAVSIKSAQLVEEIRAAHHETILRLTMAAESRDGDTGRHIQRMTLYCHLLALKSGMSETDAQTILHSAPMHDIGKLAIPDAILKKPGALTPDERSVMQQHTVLGARILENSTNPILQMGRIICLAHHERWDGGGYPSGLRGEEIPLPGRIAAIGDVFDALSSRRCYHEAKAFDEVISRIADEAGRAFDPQLARTFVTAAPDVFAIYEQHRDVSAN